MKSYLRNSVGTFQISKAIATLLLYLYVKVLPCSDLGILNVFHFYKTVVIVILRVQLIVPLSLSIQFLYGAWFLF